VGRHQSKPELSFPLNQKKHNTTRTHYLKVQIY